MTAGTGGRLRARALRAAAVAIAALLPAGTISADATPPGQTISLTLSGDLAAQGSFFVPQPVALSSHLTIHGKYLVPKPVAMHATLSVAGDFASSPPSQSNP